MNYKFVIVEIEDDNALFVCIDNVSASESRILRKCHGEHYSYSSLEEMSMLSWALTTVNSKSQKKEMLAEMAEEGIDGSWLGKWQGTRSFSKAIRVKEPAALIVVYK